MRRRNQSVMSRKRSNQRTGEENGTGRRLSESIDASPPSPFRFGWNSVIANDYPYPMPSTQKPPEREQVAPNDRPSQTGSSELSHAASGLRSGRPQATCPPSRVRKESTKLLPTINNSPEVTQAQSSKTDAGPLTRSTAKHRDVVKTKPIESPPQPIKPRILEKPPNTKALFIPKTKKPIKRKPNQVSDVPSLDQNANPARKDPVDSDQPTHTAPDTQNNVNKDPFADWDPPLPNEIEAEMKGRPEDTNQGDAEQSQERQSDQEAPSGNLEEEMKEIEKPLKLDRNLLEIIIRMVFLQIKLLEAKKNHDGILEVLHDFKKQSLGLYKTHSVLFENKLTEAVNKLMLIRHEYDQLSNPIDTDLKSSIESSVSKHITMLNAHSINLNGLFGDNWAPKPVIHLESTAVSSSIDTHNHRSTFDQPTKSSTQCDLPQESIKPVNNNHNDPCSWGDDTDKTTTDPNPIHEPENKLVECPWGAEEPAEITTKLNEAQPGSATNHGESYGWGGGQGNENDGGGGASRTGKFNNNDSGGWSNQNFDNDSVGWNNQNSNSGATNMGTDNNFEFRPRDSGWNGRRNGRGGRGSGFSHDQSGFRGRGFGFSGDRGFRPRGDGDRGGFAGRSRGGDGGGFRGRGRGFGNGNGNGFAGGNWNGPGDSAFNNNGNNSFTEGFQSGNGNGFGETASNFNSGFNDQNNNRVKGGWGDDNGFQNGFGNAGNDTKGVFGGHSKKAYGDGRDNFGNDSHSGFNASGNAGGGGGDDSRFKTGGSGGLGMLGSNGGDGWQSPKVAPNRAIVQYDTLATENSSTNDGNDWSNANPSATLQPSQINAPKGNQAGNLSTDNASDNGWGSPPPIEQVEIPSSGKHFRDLDGGSSVGNLPLKLDYGGETLMDKTDEVLNHIKPHESTQEAIKTVSDDIDPNTKMAPGNQENEWAW